MGNNLKKSITFVDAISVVIGMIIGSGIFLKSGIVFANAGSALRGMFAWILGGLITLCSALTISEIASSIPKTGGLYVYLEELYDEKTGFLLGWVQTIISYPAAAAALAIAFANFACFFISMNNMQVKILASSILIFILILNVVSTKFGGIIQVFSTIGKLIPIVLIILFGFIKGKVGNSINMTNTITYSNLGTAILGTLWAYDGWFGVTNIAEEMDNPKKNLPKAIIVGVLSVIIIYAVFNFALLKIISFNGIITSKQPATDAAIKIFGTGGAIFVVAGIMVSVLGTLNGYVMTGARVPFSMGQKRQLPFSCVFGQKHSKFDTPSNALIFQGILALMYICSGSFDALTDMLIFITWIFFIMGVSGVFILRKKYNNKDTYKVPFYPIVPLIGICGGIYIIISTLISNPINSVIGIGITVLGLPIYYCVNKIKKH